MNAALPGPKSKTMQPEIREGEVKLLMDNLLNSGWWNVLSSIGQCVGALATAAAVFIALKQARQSTVVRIGIRAAISYPTANPYETLLSLSAVNESHRAVTLETSGIMLPDGKQFVFPASLRGVLPAKLQELEATQYHVQLRELCSSLRDHGYRGRVLLRPYFSDTRGVRHWGRYRLDANLQ